MGAAVPLSLSAGVAAERLKVRRSGFLFLLLAQRDIKVEVRNLLEDLRRRRLVALEPLHTDQDPWLGLMSCRRGYT